MSSFVQVSGLKPGQKYLYRVCAENAAGVSDPAEQLGPLLADDPHGTKLKPFLILSIDLYRFSYQKHKNQQIRFILQETKHSLNSDKIKNIFCCLSQLVLPWT